MSDDGRREIREGVPMAGRAKEPVILRENDSAIELFQGDWKRFTFTAYEARHLARMLNRLALRIEKRLEVQP